MRSILAITCAWAAVAALAISAGCAQPKQKTYDEDEASSSRIGGSGGGASGGNHAQLVTIPVQVADNVNGGGFSLVAATAYDISLDSCASGYTSTANEASSALEAYKFDRGCKAKLTSFEVGGFTLIPTAGDPFTTWVAGDTATFDEAGEPGTNAVLVRVVSTLADPIAGTEAIVYEFSEIDQGADEGILEATVGDSHSMTVASQPPPSFTIHSVLFVGVTAGGAGQFEFILECTSSIGVTDDCEGVDMADITYKLVEDTYAGTLDLADANALFPAGETAVAMPADREAPGGTTVNGGFATVTLDGPVTLVGKPNMIFIMQAADTSYQYFNVDVATLTQD
jgi:hypothetical protein